MEFKDRLKSAVKQYGLKKFANEIGVHTTTVDGWTKGKNLPNGDNLLCIHRIFGIDVTAFLVGEGEIFFDKEADKKPELNDPPDVDYGKTDTSFGNAVDALKDIFDSHDPALINAIRTNLSVFRSYARKDIEMRQQSKEIQDLREKYKELKKVLEDLDCKKGSAESL